VRRLLDAKRSRRLLEDQHPRAEVYSPSDRERLTFANGQSAHEAIAVIDSPDPELSQRLDGDFVGALAVEDFERSSTFRRLFAHEERASDAHERERPAKLVDDRKSMVAGLTRAAEIDDLAIHLHRAGCRLVDPRENPDKGRFPGTVIAEQASPRAPVSVSSPYF
jgi:hypothetical protein